MHGQFRMRRRGSANSWMPCLMEGPQMVTRRGTEAAVLVPVQEWRRLQSAARPSLKDLLLSDRSRAEMALPARGQAKRRSVEPML
jgi:antitoxin Phd